MHARLAIGFVAAALFVVPPAAPRLTAGSSSPPPAQTPAGATPVTITSAHLDGLRLRNIGPANMSGRIVDIAVVEANPYVIYAASSTGGVWRTTDNGVTWTPVFQHEAVHSVGVVTVHQFEAGTSAPRRATIDVIKRAFQEAGVEFIDENGGGPGVRLRRRRSLRRE